MPPDDIDKWIDTLFDNDETDPAQFGQVDDDEPDEPPLQDSELADAHHDLTTWRSPADFHAAVSALHWRTTAKQVFNNPRQKFLLDAWTLAEFAIRNETVDRVSLAGAGEQWPDGYVHAAGKVENVEVTIALMPGRRMGDEYKFEGETKIDPVEDWIARADAIPEALDAAIARKVAKSYPAGIWLVVYLNLSEYGIRQEQTELVIAQIKSRYASAFGALFVLWKDTLY